MVGRPPQVVDPRQLIGASIQVDVLDEKSEQLSLRTPVPAVWLQLATFAPALTESPHPHTPVSLIEIARKVPLVVAVDCPTVNHCVAAGSNIVPVAVPVRYLTVLAFTGSKAKWETTSFPLGLSRSVQRQGFESGLSASLACPTPNECFGMGFWSLPTSINQPVPLWRSRRRWEDMDGDLGPVSRQTSVCHLCHLCACLHERLRLRGLQWECADCHPRRRRALESSGPSDGHHDIKSDHGHGLSYETRMHGRPERHRVQRGGHEVPFGDDGDKDKRWGADVDLANDKRVAGWDVELGMLECDRLSSDAQILVSCQLFTRQQTVVFNGSPCDRQSWHCDSFSASRLRECLATMGGFVVKTSDGGKTWTTLFSADPNSGVVALSCATTKYCVAGGDAKESAFLWTTNDGGQIWTRPPFPLLPVPRSLRPCRFGDCSAGT